MAVNLAWSFYFMHIALHYSFSTKTCGPTIFKKITLPSLKVAFVASIAHSLEIPSCSWIST
jgi:hypothetical protein